MKCPNKIKKKVDNILADIINGLSEKESIPKLLNSSIS